MAYGPKDLFDTMLELDWAGRFESFDPDRRGQLQLYDSLASELGDRSFFAHPQVLTLRTGADGGVQDLQHAGEDSLRSMTMTFRQLWMDNEPARFQTVLTLLLQHAKPPRDRVDVTVLLKEIGRRYRVARRAVRMKHVDPANPFGEPLVEFRAEQVINDWLYGGQFHTDSASAKRVTAWSKTMYEWAVVESVEDIAAVMWGLHLVVRGALGSPAVAAA